MSLKHCPLCRSEIFLSITPFLEVEGGEGVNLVSDKTAIDYLREKITSLARENEIQVNNVASTNHTLQQVKQKLSTQKLKYSVALESMKLEKKNLQVTLQTLHQQSAQEIAHLESQLKEWSKYSISEE